MSNVIASQTELHAQYGGIFPEVASRKHIEVIHAVIAKAMSDAYLGFEDLDCIAVTQGPGLVGSLLVGLNVAKGLALARHKPLLGINHIEGHIYSLWLDGGETEFEFPILTLVVSGGHTELILMTDHLQYEHLGGTLDDAAGEAFDKVGRLLGLPYPGGPEIDRVSEGGNARAFDFPRAVMDEGYDFSFSGLKTAVLRETQRYDEERLPVPDLAASFQAAVVDVLVEKTMRAASEYEVKAVHLAGGVSANRALRWAMNTRLEVPVRYPPLVLCTDNAAMIAAAAHQHFVRGARHDLDMDVVPSLQLAW
jgi:N6-L-threonylcarbamoyladenine synthase